MQPQVFLSTQCRNLAHGIDHARANAAGRGNDEKRQPAGVAIKSNLFAQLVDAQTSFAIGIDPANTLGPEAADVGRLLHPGMRLAGYVGGQPAVIAVVALGTQIPWRFRCAGGNEAENIGHVAA